MVIRYFLTGFKTGFKKVKKISLWKADFVTEAALISLFAGKDLRFL